MSKFKVGDKVKLNPEISDFKYGRGKVTYDEIGEIIKLVGVDDYYVEFPNHEHWHGRGNDVVLVDEVENPSVEYEFVFKTTQLEVNKVNNMIINKEEKDMNKILQLYKERKEKEIEDRYNKIIEEEYNKIEFIEVYNNLVDAFEGAMKELFENEENIGCKYMKDTGISYNAYKYQLNHIEIKRELRKKYSDDYIREIKKLNDFIKEVETTLSLAENGNGEINQDRVIEILSNYQIIDKKTLKIKE